MDTNSGRVVVGVDGSDQANVALSWAVQEAVLRSAPLDVVHAWQAPATGLATTASTYGVTVHDAKREAQEILDQAIQTVGAPEGTSIRPHLIQGSDANVLLDVASDANLLVVGSRGRGGVASLLLGSVSQQCAQRSTCPVVIVPAA